MGLESRGQPGTGKERQQQWKNASEQQKMYAISQEEVKQAWLRVRAKGGIGGIDGEGIKSFEEQLDKNLYKLWNRMSVSAAPAASLRFYFKLLAVVLRE
jgi:hypothetical protein